MHTTTILRSLLAIATAVTAATAQTTPCVTFQVVADNGAATPIQDGAITTAVVKLNEAFANNPPTEVQVSAPGVLCGRTKFTFTKGDRSTFEQRVTCRTATGSAPASDGTVVDVPVTLTYKNGPRVSDVTTIKRRVTNSGRCGGAGDPHLVTLDGVAYDFQKQGVFRMFESNSFQVQIYQDKCVNVASAAMPSCYQGVAVAFGASVVRFVIGEDGTIRIGKGSASLQWLSVEKVGNANADGYRVYTNVDKATYVEFNLYRWGMEKYWLLNIALQVSPYFKNANDKGLMGNWNGDRGDDLTNPDQLAAAHAVPINNNLFTCEGDACASLLKPSAIADSNAAALPSGEPLVHDGYVAVAPDAVVLRSFQPKILTLTSRQLQQANTNGTTTVPKANAVAKSNAYKPVVTTARATQLCRQVISSIATICSKYVLDTPGFITRVCVADAVLLNDLGVVDGAKLTYLRDCRRELEARLSTKTACANETKQLLRDRARLFFGDLSSCFKECSGRGDCLPAGCQCNTGFTGEGCGITYE